MIGLYVRDVNFFVFIHNDENGNLSTVGFSNIHWMDESIKGSFATVQSDKK